MVGFLLGFALMPATVGLIAGFATITIHFKIPPEDIVLGAAAGIAVAIIGGAITVRVLVTRM